MSGLVVTPHSSSSGPTEPVRAVVDPVPTICVVVPFDTNLTKVEVSAFFGMRVDGVLEAGMSSFWMKREVCREKQKEYPFINSICNVLSVKKRVNTVTRKIHLPFHVSVSLRFIVSLKSPKVTFTQTSSLTPILSSTPSLYPFPVLGSKWRFEGTGLGK